MASNKAHHATGWAAGVIAAALVAHADAGGPYQVLSMLAFVMGALGGTAPDWLEVAWWARTHRLWITHRTWTHWGLAWIALLVYTYLQLPHHLWAPPLFGFAAGGIMHLLADWPNPLGVPWIFPPPLAALVEKRPPRHHRHHRRLAGRHRRGRPRVFRWHPPAAQPAGV